MTNISGSLIVMRRIMMSPSFATDKGPDDVVSVKHWVGDGTFKSSIIFYQFSILHIQIGSFTVSSLFAFIPNENQETYARFSNKLN